MDTCVFLTVLVLTLEVGWWNDFYVGTLNEQTNNFVDYLKTYRYIGK